MLDTLKEQLKQLNSKTEELKNILKIEIKREKLAKIEQEAADPKLWQDQAKAKKLMQIKKGLQKELETWQELASGTEDLETLISVAAESDLSELKKEADKLQVKSNQLELTALLGGEYDQNNAILSIQAGAGGTDAQDWAQILLRMYSRWAEAKEYSVEMTDVSYGEEAGIKGATLIISGLYAYGYLKTENGIHRLVRMSPFNADGKRHTSFAAVEVIPEISQDIKVDINPADLRIDTYRASGPGGQHVNKTDSAIRITHIPTNIVVQSQSQRSQHQNREYAMRILKAKLAEMMATQQKEKIEELSGERKKIEWGSQIRSYVFHPYTMVKDHRTNQESGNVQAVIDGDLDNFIEAALRQRSK